MSSLTRFGAQEADDFFRQKFPQIAIPQRGTVFDHYIDLENQSQLKLWAEKIPQFMPEPRMPAYLQMVLRVSRWGTSTLRVVGSSGTFALVGVLGVLAAAGAGADNRHGAALAPYPGAHPRRPAHVPVRANGLRQDDAHQKGA